MIGAMSDWEQFLAGVPWFLRPGQQVIVEAATHWSRGRIEGLPRLSALLSSATVTRVAIDHQNYDLLAWGPRERRRGWLCLPPPDSPFPEVQPIHQAFLAATGGIIERFREPRSWWINQDEVLTISAASLSFPQVIDDYAWLWKNHQLKVPIEPEHYYPAAVEANGNLTLVHRVTGDLILFAPDHAFNGVTPLPGCPPYSLMTIDEARNLAAWIEACAEAWSSD
jgi:hypothetical protein